MLQRRYGFKDGRKFMAFISGIGPNGPIDLFRVSFLNNNESIYFPSEESLAEYVNASDLEPNNQ